MTLLFPRRLLREKSHSWNLVGVAVTPGQTAQSVAPIIRSDGGGFWSLSMSDVSLSGGGALRGKDRQKITTLLWRAIRQVCDGGVNAIVVPRNDALFRPWPVGLAQAASIVTHDDDTLFDDAAGYFQSVIDISCVGGATLRATSMVLALNYCGTLQGGEAFSIEHPTMGWRMYEIATVTPIDAAHVTVTFMPPLREAVSDGDQLEFDRPCCTMRLGKPSSMDLSIAPWTFNSASADFVEAFI
jgi:hypothetical protein